MLLYLSKGASPVRPSELIYNYYPQVRPIQQAAFSNRDSILDVLILSCSVLHQDWGDIINEMQKQMKLPAPYQSMRVYNASGVGHGSRDNRSKYALLKDKPFDVVIYYDAINDARLNNCPPAVFKSDYTHYTWYEQISTIQKHGEINITVLPYLAEELVHTLKHLLAKGQYIPVHYSLSPDWLMYGNTYKSLPSYTDNLQSVVAQAQEAHSRFLYISFLYHSPKNYSLQNFRSKTLDYSFCNHSRETEIWGLAPNVSGFIDAANAAAQQQLSGVPGCSFEDLRMAFPNEGKYYADICHFSPEGLTQFAALLNSRIERTMGAPSDSAQ